MFNLKIDKQSMLFILILIIINTYLSYFLLILHFVTLPLTTSI
jgi:hypothetical protein